MFNQHKFLDMLGEVVSIDYELEDRLMPICQKIIFGKILFNGFDIDLDSISIQDIKKLDRALEQYTNKNAGLGTMCDILFSIPRKRDVQFF